MDADMSAFVVNKLLSSGCNEADALSSLKRSDSNASLLADQLAGLCLRNALNTVASQSRDLSAVAFNHTCDVADGGKRKALQTKLDRHLNELEGETAKIKSAWEKAVLVKKSEVNFKKLGNDKIVYYNGKIGEYNEQIKSKERVLSKVGFSERLSNEALKTLEVKNIDKRVQIKSLQDNVSSFNGIEPSNDALRERIKQLKDEVANDIYNISTD